MQQINLSANRPRLFYKGKFSWKRFFMQWEWMLFGIFLLINLMNALISPNYLRFDNIMNTMIIFLDKALMVYGIMMVLLLGEIDISVASIVTLSGVCAAISYEAGMSIAAAVLVALTVGAACGAFNGLLLVKFRELNSTIVTLGNMIFFRGVAYMILEDGSLNGYAKGLSFLAWDYVGGIPIILITFLAMTLVFAFLIHRSKFGRRMYAMGSNTTASYFSGVQTSRIKLIVFTLSGLCAAISGLFLVAKLGSVRASIAKGYEMEVIAMAILGGVSTSGGKGRVIGVALGVFTIGLLRYGLGLINVSSQILMIIIGGLLIIAVAIPNLKQVVADSALYKRIRAHSAIKK